MKYRKGEQIIQTFCRISYPQEIKSPFFNLYKFKNPEKSAPESCGMYWNLMNDEEIGFIKLLKLKYGTRDQITQTSCKIGSPQKLGPPSLIWRNFNAITKVLLNHENELKSNEWRRIWVLKTLEIEIQKGLPNNSDYLQNWFPPEIKSPLFNL